MGSLKSRLESWIRDQTVRMGISWPPPLPQPPLLWKWPPWKGRESRKEQERLLKEEYERQRRQLNDLCRAVKAESLADLQDVLCSMVLSECVYKRPASEMLRFINKFKSDFGGQIVALERVQHSLDHVPHRYLLAEAGDTLFASFIGTKQYKDVIADANIFQGAIFHDDHAEDLNVIGSAESNQLDVQKKSEGTVGKSLQVKPQTIKTSKPAAHRGFLARAKGIPALELYKLAQQKNRKLVLCGHSLGGAVATLATLAILRVLASTLSKEQDKVQVKCITFSQPPVGNAALKDYVDRKGWQHYFKTYCIPEDVVPRILSPAYFHHYNEQTIQRSADSTNSHPTSVKREELIQGLGTAKPKANDGEPLVLGLGPLQTSVWRLSKLVPLEGIRKQLNVLKRVGRGAGEVFSTTDRVVPLTADEVEGEPQSLEIEEGSEGITLNPLPEKEEKRSTEANGSSLDGKNSGRDGDSRRWQRVPYLPSYVPFGQLYLLGNSSVESLSDAEYSKLTSVKSVISELKERLQSHSMQSYRSRFQSIYDQCMGINTSLFLGIEQLPQFPQLQKWLGLAAVGAVELGHIVDPPVIRTATSIVPLGWTGVPADKNSDPLKVDILGHGLHLCTLVQAQVNGSWCSTVVESLPCAPPHRADNYVKPDLQKMRIIVGPPLKQPPKYPVLDECVSSSLESDIGAFVEEKRSCAERLGDFIIYCTTDFITVSKKVHVRTRRIRLLGFEGAGKTSLFRAVMEHARQRSKIKLENLHQFIDSQEGVGGGVCYLDSAGINLQELHLESARFKEELQAGSNDLNKKTDLVVLVHNLSHKVSLYHQMQASQPQPALSILLNEAKALNIPWILAITNKFSVSANQQKMMAKYAMDAYGASSSMTEAINSCPFVMPSSASSLQLQDPVEEKLSRKDAAQRMLLAPLAFARMPFKSKASVLPIEGVAAFQQLVHRVLRSNEEIAFQELANERYLLELAREQERALSTRPDSQGKGSSVTAAAVGASLGAGLGIVLALVMGAASALRKP